MMVEVLHYREKNYLVTFWQDSAAIRRLIEENKRGKGLEEEKRAREIEELLTKLEAACMQEHGQRIPKKQH